MSHLPGRKVWNRKRGKRFHREEFTKHNQLNGICFYLHDRGLRDAKDQHHIIKLYVIYMQWEIPKEKHILAASAKIQEDFKSFTSWFYNLKR